SLADARGSDFWLPRLLASLASSTSVITTFHEPAERGTVNAVERSSGEGDIPFVAGPGIGSPPVSGRSPWTGDRDNAAADSPGFHVVRPAVVNGHAGGSRRTKNAQRQTRFRLR